MFDFCCFIIRFVNTSIWPFPSLFVLLLERRIISSDYQHGKFSSSLHFIYRRCSFADVLITRWYGIFQSAISDQFHSIEVRLTKIEMFDMYILSVVAVLFLFSVVRSHHPLNTSTYLASIVSKHERQLCSTISASRSVPDKQTQPQIETYKQKQSVTEGWRRGRVVGKRRQNRFQRLR